MLNPHAILDTVGVIGMSALKYSGMEQLFFYAGMYCCFVDLVFWFNFCWSSEDKAGWDRKYNDCFSKKLGSVYLGNGYLSIYRLDLMHKTALLYEGLFCVYENTKKSFVFCVLVQTSLLTAAYSIA